MKLADITLTSLLILIDQFDQTQGKLRIIGGEKAPIGEYEWFYEANGCGASLIAPDMLLTAAHCSDSFANALFYTRYSHPKYVESDAYVSYDYMVVKLAFPVLDVTPVPLDDGTISSTYDSSKSLWTLGHGDILEDDEKDFYPDDLLRAQVKYMTPCDCEPRYFGLLDSTMMCAADFVTGADACQGDSGGPLYDEVNDLLVGIVSWGYGCSDEFYPGVYSRVADQLPWIKTVVCSQTDFYVSYCTNDLGEQNWSCSNYLNWKDRFQPQYDCAHFERYPTLCTLGGDKYKNWLDEDATDACCICDGGSRVYRDEVDRSSFTCQREEESSGAKRRVSGAPRIAFVMMMAIMIFTSL